MTIVKDFYASKPYIVLRVLGKADSAPPGVAVTKSSGVGSSVQNFANRPVPKERQVPSGSLRLLKATL
jgi:hypothetical protein